MTCGQPLHRAYPMGWRIYVVQPPVGGTGGCRGPRLRGVESATRRSSDEGGLPLEISAYCTPGAWG